MHTSLLSFWRTQPAWLRERLLHGSVGSAHCLRLASDALTAAGEAGDDVAGAHALFRAGRTLLLAAWEEDPCNGQLAAQLLTLHGRVPWLGQGTERLLAAVAAAWRPPDDLAPLERLGAAGDWEGALALAASHVTGAGCDLFWLRQVLVCADLAGSPSRAAELVTIALGETPALENLRRGGFEPLAPLALYLEGCRLAATESPADMARALAMFRGCSALVADHATAPEGAWLAPMERAGHCMARLGARDGALALWRSVLRARPWHVSLVLRAHDVALGRDVPAPGPPGKTAALLYSWNKADELDGALHALSASLDDIALVVCLDNGSTDATGDVVRLWADRMGADRFVPVHLPVNVGAAAARNWLMRMPEVAQCEFAAYLDDDAAVPRDWLRHFARAVEARPAASAWGCRVVDWHAPALVQSAALHLVPCFALPEVPAAGRSGQGHRGAAGRGGGDATMTAGDGARASSPGLPDAASAYSPALAHGLPFTVSDLHCQTTDLGRFDHVRSCISVTGCCHLFRTDELKARGGFALSLSPSQYDDFEHDLRAARAGRLACYDGFFSVRHMKRTGKAVRMSAAQYGNGLGNRYKLHGMYDAETIAQMHHMEMHALEQDLLERLAMLDALARRG